MRFTKTTRALLAALLFLIPFSPLAAEVGGTVTGVAELGGAPLAGASIAIDCVENSAYIGTATADAAGAFAVTGVPVGGFSVRAFDADDQLVLQGTGIVEADGDTVTVILVPPQE